jgi:hypothetical protein
MASFEQIKRQKDLKLKEQREMERMADEQMKRVIKEKKALAKKKAIAEKKALAEKKAMVEKKVLAERAEDDAFKAEIAKLEREQQKREKTIAEAKARGRARAIEELQTKDAEEQAYKKQAAELKSAAERKAEQELTAQLEAEAAEALRAERRERQQKEAVAKAKAEQRRAAEKAEAELRRKEEYAKMMAEYKEKETPKVVTDAAAPLAEPMVTVTSEEKGMAHSYPKRDFKPEQPKTEETVTLKTSGEIHDGTGRVADKAVLVGMGLAMTASIVLMMARKFRSPIAAPDAEIALTSRTDLEDPEPIAPADELAESWASSAVERALAAADGKA